MNLDQEFCQLVSSREKQFERPTPGETSVGTKEIAAADIFIVIDFWSSNNKRKSSKIDSNVAIDPKLTDGAGLSTGLKPRHWQNWGYEAEGKERKQDMFTDEWRQRAGESKAGLKGGSELTSRQWWKPGETNGGDSEHKGGWWKTELRQSRGRTWDSSPFFWTGVYLWPTDHHEA